MLNFFSSLEVDFFLCWCGVAFDSGSVMSSVLRYGLANYVVFFDLSFQCRCSIWIFGVATKGSWVLLSGSVFLSFIFHVGKRSIRKTPEVPTAVQTVYNLFLLFLLSWIHDDGSIYECHCVIFAGGTNNEIGIWSKDMPIKVY